MAFFAVFDPAATQPAPVTGWYDTSFVEYGEIPGPECMVEMTAEQWAVRFQTPFVENGALVAGPPPPRFVPPMVTNFQCRAMLIQLGLFDTVDAEMQSMGGVALQAWEYANTVDRRGALVTNMAAALGLSPDEVDDLFIEAAGIVA
jgi:hypothetical protein